MKIIFCLIKGRNYKESLFYLKKKSLKIEKEEERRLYIKSNKKNLYFFEIKNKDFKKYLNKTDFMIIGEDIFINYNINFFFNFKFIKINTFFISIISNKKYILKKKKIIIWTKYKDIIKKYLKFKNINFKLKKINSSIENFTILKNNIICDIVSTGKTIKENKILEIKKILNFNNILILNKNLIYNKIFLEMLKIYVSE
ncbi:MAG: ATP phosphoribosyltransferase [Candidatus Nasuia deltocephalinicola]